MTELLRSEKGRNTLFLLKMKGTKQERQAMLRDAQIDPLTRQFIHLDFIRVMKGQRIKIQVPVLLEGESIGVKAGGFLDWVSRSLHIECAAESIPSSFTVDISALERGDHVTADQLPLPEGVRLLDDPHKIVVTIAVHGQKPEEEAAAAEAPAEEGAEPEVIRRGKAAEEESEE